MNLDAFEQGNITRFINHAHSNKETHETALIEANIAADSYYINGIELVLFSEKKKIFPGEQLLVDYGAPFFQTHQCIRFKMNGNLTDKWDWLHPQQKINYLRVMARYKVKKAQMYLMVRMLIIIVLISILIGFVAAQINPY